VSTSTPDVIANVRHALLFECLCDAEKIEISYDCGDSGSKKYKQDYGGAYGAVWFSLRQAVGFVLVNLLGM
jgi:hypothetical protein